MNDLDRKTLQRLAKENNLKANMSSDELRSALTALNVTVPSSLSSSSTSSSKKRKSKEELDGSVNQKAKVEVTEDTLPAPTPSDLSKPYLNHKFVVTGSFPVSSDMIERRISALGGSVVKAVNKSTTHVLLGNDGTTEYGGKIGKGSKKYKDAVKKKCAILTYDDLTTAESGATPPSSSGASSSSSSTCVSLLQTEWNALLDAISRGVSLGLWPAPIFNPPASSASIAALEAELGYRIGKYADLLLLADGVTWYAAVGGESVSVQFGGTGDGEDDVLHAFNYSGDYGRKHFRKKKQVPMCMMDYDFCVNVFELQSGRVMQDDRECDAYRRLAGSLQDWLNECTEETLSIVEKARNVAPPSSEP